MLFLMVSLQNTDSSVQNLRQHVLILRPTCMLNLILLGHDFLSTNNAELIFSFRLNKKCIRNDNENSSAQVFFIGPEPEIHATQTSPPSNIFGSTTPVSMEEFTSFYKLCLYEKSLNHYKKSKHRQK